MDYIVMILHILCFRLHPQPKSALSQRLALSDRTDVSPVTVTDVGFPRHTWSCDCTFSRASPCPAERLKEEEEDHSVCSQTDTDWTSRTAQLTQDKGQLISSLVSTKTKA